ncbi:hypothetical protein DFJ74DRAFT_654605 [Hyaloraphidium curvatum]|nr:hypothetical protein DFJ74DRAFT_654605 [Hyaloraphidium curvatum]
MSAIAIAEPDAQLRFRGTRVVDGTASGDLTRAASSEELPTPTATFGKRTDVWFSLNCRLESIDPVAQQFAISGYLNFFWEDAKFESPDDDGANQPVDPDAVFENAVEFSLFGPPVFRVRNSVVSEMIHFKAVLYEELELDRFPFDRQFLTIRICLKTKEFRAVSEAPNYVPDKHDWRSMASFTCSPSVAGWSAISPIVGTSVAAGQSDELRITVSLRVERQWRYFLYNIVLIVFLIVCLSPIAFLMGCEDVGGRMSIILTLLLTLVTFKFVVASEIPKTPALTLLDKYFFVSYFALLLVVLQTVLGHLLAPARRVPVDRASAIGLLVCWIAFHVQIVNTALADGFSQPWEELKDEAAGKQARYAVLPGDIVLPKQ